MLGTNNTLSTLRGFGFSKAFKLRGRLQSGVLLCQRMARSVYPLVSPPDLPSDRVSDDHPFIHIGFCWATLCTDKESSENHKTSF